MVDFRYHLVSIIAVFLALAVGIVIGTTALNGVVTDDLRKRVDGLVSDKHNLQDANDTLSDSLDASHAWAKTVAPLLVADRLSGRRVTVVSAPGAATGTRDDLVRMLTSAGATVTISVRLSDSYGNDDALLAETAARLPLTETPACTLPAKPTGADIAAAAIASLLTNSSTPNSDRTAQALTQLRTAGLLTPDGPVDRPGNLVLVVAGKAPSKSTKDDTQAPAVVSLTRCLRESSSDTVVAGPREAADSGGLIASVLADTTLSKRVGTVDTADVPEGQVSTVFALEAGQRGLAPHYGTAPSAQSPISLDGS